MHKVNDVMVNGTRVSNLFSSRDEHWHTTTIRPIKSLYSMSRVIDVEYGVDKSIKAYTNKLQEKFIDGPQPAVCDMSDWMLYCETYFKLLPYFWVLTLDSQLPGTR